MPVSFVLERARERGDGLAVGALEQPALAALELEQVPEVARVEDELLLVRAPVRRAERHADARAREPLDDAEQLERPERLQEERVGAGCARDVLDVLHAR